MTKPPFLDTAHSRKTPKLKADSHITSPNLTDDLGQLRTTYVHKNRAIFWGSVLAMPHKLTMNSIYSPNCECWTLELWQQRALHKAAPAALSRKPLTAETSHPNPTSLKQKF